MSTGDVLCDESAGYEMKRDIRSVLVVCTRRIGDVLLATPVVRSLKRAYPEACLIFIRPPSVEILEQRLRARLTEDAETLRQRMERVPMELDQARLFDHEVVNDVLSKATDEVDAIVKQHIQQS